MNIKEAEKITGVSSRNIRFYEQKGLLKPSRNRENDYREYSDEDIHTLMLIRILRMLDMPLEQIRGVLEDKLSLQTAATQQSEKLKTQIEKMQTAVRFCEELAKEENPDIEALLTRMDEPENREMLSKKWTADHTEILKNSLLAFAAGFLPLIIGCGLLLPSFLALVMSRTAAVMIALVFPSVWMAVGGYFYKRDHWVWNMLAAHIIPTAVFSLNAHWEHWLGLVYAYPLVYLKSAVADRWLEEHPNCVATVLFMVVCFLLGGQVVYLAEKVGKWCKKDWKLGKDGSFTAKISEKLPLKRVIVGIVIVLAISAPFVWDTYAPLDDAVKPAAVQAYLENRDSVRAEIYQRYYTISDTAGLSEKFAFSKWERIYVLPGYAETVCTVSLEWHNLFGGSDYSVEIRRDDIVVVKKKNLANSWGYFRLPEGTAERVLNYVKSCIAEEAKN